jgi:RNA polymerase sigma-70 factor (ECF subfamily)
VIDYYRKGKIEVTEIEKIQIKDPTVNPEGEAILNSDLKELKKALCELPEDYQNMIIWYYLDELNVSEIAEISGKSENATRVTIHRALQALRDKMPPK